MVAAAGSTPATSLRKKNTATTRTRLTPTTSPSLASLGMGKELRDQSARTTSTIPPNHGACRRPPRKNAGFPKTNTAEEAGDESLEPAALSELTARTLIFASRSAG